MAQDGSLRSADEVGRWRSGEAVGRVDGPLRVGRLRGWWDELGAADDAPGRWFAVDAVEQGGLHVVVRHDPVPDGHDPAPPPMLEASWYPGGVVPAVLPGILAVLTGAVVRRVLDGEPPAAATADLAAAFVALVPTGERAQARETTATWLERVADRLDQPPSASPAPTAFAPEPAAPDAVARLAPLADGLHRWAAAVAEHAGLSPADARDRAVARAVHSTALLARLGDDGLRAEAALVRTLALDGQDGDQQR